MTTTIAGISRENPSEAFRALVATTSDAMARSSQATGDIVTKDGRNRRLPEAVPG
jgi:hypothetical protein